MKERQDRTETKFSPLETLWAEVSDALDPPYEPEKCLRRLLHILHNNQTLLSNWEAVLQQRRPEAAYESLDVQREVAELLEALSESEKEELREHYLEKLSAIEQRYPDLKQEFPEQFR